VLLHEAGLLGIDQVGTLIERRQSQIVIAFELLGQERLFEPQRKSGDVALFVAIDFDLVRERQRFVGRADDF
jgi:hypothetical protein